MNTERTAMEQIEDVRQLVSWVLWNISTQDPNEFEDPTSGTFTEGEVQAIQCHAQMLFQNSSWMAEVTAKFLAGQVKDAMHKDAAFSAFEALGERLSANLECDPSGNTLFTDDEWRREMQREDAMLHGVQGHNNWEGQ